MSEKTTTGLASKGSKYWIQSMINNKNGHDLTKSIQKEDSSVGDVKWLSPLSEEDYREYQINSPVMIEKLLSEGINLKKPYDLDFWPSEGPYWDAIGTYKDPKESKPTLVLVEVKTNAKEMESPKGAKGTSAYSVENQILIEHSMYDAYKRLGPGKDFDLWLHKYYQLGKRLTFLNALDKIINVKLVLLNIVDDETDIKFSQSEWDSHYNYLFEQMLGLKKQLKIKAKNIIVVYSSGNTSKHTQEK